MKLQEQYILMFRCQ